MDALEVRNQLVSVLQMDERILSIGETGDLSPVLIPGKSDIDLFVLCAEIPSVEERKEFYQKIPCENMEIEMSVCNGGIWGYGDILLVNGIDVMPMFFTEEEMRTYLVSVLSGEHLYKEGRFYPVGRVASVSTIQVLFEREEAWSKLKNMVNEKPLSFFKKWYLSEISQVLDEEDLGRSELRKEVLFFHQVLENALDHLLQSIYAVNLMYFPSRKRTLKDLTGFPLKPVECEKRLLFMIECGSKEEGIMEAISELRKLTEEVKEFGNKVFISADT